MIWARMMGREEICAGVWFESYKERHQYKFLDVGEMIILE
jgi:hypothetical protein